MCRNLTGIRTFPTFILWPNLTYYLLQLNIRNHRSFTNHMWAWQVILVTDLVTFWRVFVFKKMASDKPAFLTRLSIWLSIKTRLFKAFLALFENPREFEISFASNLVKRETHFVVPALYWWHVPRFCLVPRFRLVPRFGFVARFRLVPRFGLVPRLGQTDATRIRCRTFPLSWPTERKSCFGFSLV